MLFRQATTVLSHAVSIAFEDIPPERGLKFREIVLASGQGLSDVCCAFYLLIRHQIGSPRLWMTISLVTVARVIGSLTTKTTVSPSFAQ